MQSNYRCKTRSGLHTAAIIGRIFFLLVVCCGTIMERAAIKNFLYRFFRMLKQQDFLERLFKTKVQTYGIAEY
jgi:hypothetical protein